MLFSRRKPVGITSVIDALSNTIDPAKTKRFVYRFRPCDAWFARTPFV
jgi:hypothetical protein